MRHEATNMADRHGSGSTSPLSYRQHGASSLENSTMLGAGEADERSPLLQPNTGRSRVRIQSGAASPKGKASLSRSHSYTGKQTGHVYSPGNGKTFG